MARLPIRSVAPEQRPREKLLRHGVSALDDQELTTVVIGHGTAGRDALEVAAGVLAAAGGVHGITRLGRSSLARVPGVGDALASRLLAAVELGRRTLMRPPHRRRQFLTARDFAEFLLPKYGAFPLERFGVVLLDTRQRLIDVRLISVGSLDASIADPREVYREATLVGAARVLAFHNHPSGDATPSPDDVILTHRLAAAGEVLGINLVDHLVLADASFVSIKALEKS